MSTNELRKAMYAAADSLKMAGKMMRAGLIPWNDYATQSDRYNAAVAAYELAADREYAELDEHDEFNASFERARLAHIAKYGAEPLSIADVAR